MTEPDPRTVGLLAANTAFYGAFEQLDLSAMRDVWAEGEETVCIHPGWQMCRGREEVEESWRRIFENTPYIEFAVTVLHHSVEGNMGWLMCEESILQGNPRGLTRTLVLSTNMFRERDGRWQMTLHHGSPVAQGARADAD